jgi:hypothetical protein
MGRSTLADGALGTVIHQDGKVGVGMNVNEPWCNEPATDVKGFPPPERTSWSNLGYPTALNAYIAPEPGIPASI